MKYTIETTEDGWVETLEIRGQTYVKNWKKVDNGRYKCEEGDFTDRIIADGAAPTNCEEDLYEVVDDGIDGLGMYNFERDILEDEV